jgi:hypothetical protein
LSCFCLVQEIQVKDKTILVLKAPHWQSVLQGQLSG